MQGMNRIRHAYFELAPELEPCFVPSQYDDQAGMLQSLIGETRASPAQPFLAVPGVIAVVDSVVAGAAVGIAGLGLRRRYGWLFDYRWHRPRRVGRRVCCRGEKADRALGGVGPAALSDADRPGNAPRSTRWLDDVATWSRSPVRARTRPLRGADDQCASG